MAMGVVDTLFVGPLGPEAIGAVSVGNVAYFTPVFFGMGLLLGLDTLVSQAFGARDLDDAKRSLAQGTTLSLALTPPVVLVVLTLPACLRAIGVQPEVLREARPYLAGLIW